MEKVIGQQECRFAFNKNRKQYKKDSDKYFMQEMIDKTEYERIEAKQSFKPLPRSKEFDDQLVKMERISDEMYSEYLKTRQFIETSCKRLEDYKRARESLPSQSDGIYVIVRGEAKVINQYDGQKLANLKQGDYFGGNLFLKEQRFTTYGDIVAHRPASPPAEHKKLKDMPTLKSTETVQLEKKRTEKLTQQTLSKVQKNSLSS